METASKAARRCILVLGGLLHVPAIICLLTVLTAGVVARESFPGPTDVPGFVPPAPGEHPRLFFRKHGLPAMRARMQTPEGQAILKRLRCLLNGGDGESLPQYYNCARKAYDTPEKLRGDDLKEEIRSMSPGPSEAMDETELDGELAALARDQDRAEKKPNGKPEEPFRPPWARKDGVYLWGTDLPVGAFTVSHAAGYAFLYLLTDDPKYAGLARQCVEIGYSGQRDRDNRYSWHNPGGMLRTGPAIACIAMAYDFAYDGWPEEFRRDLALRIQNYRMGTGETMEQLCHGPRMVPSSNHWGPQVGGAAIGLLAIRDDPGTDTVLIDRHLAGLQKNTVALFTQGGFGSNGGYGEGHHPARMTSAYLLPAFSAWKNCVGKDWVTDNPRTHFIATRWIYEIMRVRDHLAINMYGRYARTVFHRGGMSAGGEFAAGFGAVPEAHVPAVKWFYNHVIDPRPAEEKDYEAVVYPHRAVWAFTYWPVDVPERNPSEVLPRVWHDYRKGTTVFRNGWHEDPSEDIVVTVNMGSRRGYGGADYGGFAAFIGLGRKHYLPSWFYGCTTSYLRTAPDGSGIISSIKGKSYLAVDYSKASGADALIVMTGEGVFRGLHKRGAWTMPPGCTGIRPNMVADLNGWKVAVVTLQKGEPPEIRAEDDRIVAGEQVVTFADGKFSLAVMGPGPEPFVVREHFVKWMHGPPDDPAVARAQAARARAEQQEQHLAEARRLVTVRDLEAAKAELEAALELGRETAQGRAASGLMNDIILEESTQGMEIDL